MIDARTGRCLLSRVEVARGLVERTVGLMGHKELKPDTGMYFPGCSSIHMFFMSFPIDVAYLDTANRIKKIVPNLKPWRLSGCWGASSVLEAPAGWVRKARVSVDMQVSFEPADEVTA